MFSISPLIIFLLGKNFTAKLKIYSFVSAAFLFAMTFAGINFVLKNLQTGLLENSIVGISEKLCILISTLWIIIFLLNFEKLEN